MWEKQYTVIRVAFRVNPVNFSVAISLCVYRMLEEGKVDESDKQKDDIEENQRERRKELAKRGEEHVPRFFK